MQRNVSLVFAAKTIRTFCYGFMAVLLPIHLAQMELSKTSLGLAFSLSLFVGAFATRLAAIPSRRFGPHRTLAMLHGITVLSGILFLFAQTPWVLILAMAIGNLAIGVGESGPFLALEQVVLARSIPNERMTFLMSIYNLLGYVAAGLGGVIVGAFSTHLTIFFGLFIVGGVIQSLLCLGFTHVEASKPPSLSLEGNHPLIRKIALLFSLDAFAGGFIVQGWIVYWFYSRFGVALSGLGWIYFATQVATGLSLLMAAPLAKRLGLVNAMVFSHFLSNIVLMAVPFAPTAKIAACILIARHLISQIDVPTRQTFLMLAVHAHEREYASTLTTFSRSLAQTVSPSITGLFMQSSYLSLPFLLGGGLKIAYDVWIYRVIRKASLQKLS